jgi:cytochrome c oxidase assembly factor CtaG
MIPSVNVLAATVQAPGWGSWSFAPLGMIAIAAVTVVYIRMYRRAAQRAAKPPGPGHWVPYAAGIGTLIVALFSPVDAIGDEWLLSAHMIQHVLLSDIAPALLILGLRAPILPLGLSRPALLAVAPGRRTGKVIAKLTSPWVAVPLWAIATWVWAIPAVFDFAAEHSTVHAFEHATLFYTGMALWWLIIDPLPHARRESNGSRLALLGFSRLASAAVCLPLAWMSSTQYPLYANAPRAYGISALTDQRLAGASMCLIEFLVFGIAFVVVFMNILDRSDASIELSERIAGTSGGF